MKALVHLAFTALNAIINATVRIIHHATQSAANVSVNAGGSGELVIRNVPTGIMVKIAKKDAQKICRRKPRVTT